MSRTANESLVCCFRNANTSHFSDWHDLVLSAKLHNGIWPLTLGGNMARAWRTAVSFCPPTSWLTASQGVSQQRSLTAQSDPFISGKPCQDASVLGGKVT